MKIQWEIKCGVSVGQERGHLEIGNWDILNLRASN